MVVAPAAAEYVPAGHGVATAEPELQKDPAGQHDENPAKTLSELRLSTASSTPGAATTGAAEKYAPVGFVYAQSVAPVAPAKA